MKNYSRRPTDENALELLQNDQIGRWRTVLRFIKLLSFVEDDCYSIALNGEWGSGKTFFIKQAKLILDAYNPHSSLSEETRESIKKLEIEDFEYPANYTTVYYDAWINDNHVDPILSLIYATIESNQSDFSVGREIKIDEAAAAIAQAVTGRHITNGVIALKGTDRFAPISESESIKDLVRDFLDALIVEHGDRLVFFIDELDRCRPDYAISFLERIKHFFDDKRVTFVFAVNLEQLQCTVKTYYGSEFDATRYMDKFFDLQMSLPHVDYDRFLLSLGMDISTRIDRVCIETAKYFHFSLRETERYIRLCKIARKAAYTITPEFPEEAAKLFSVTYFVPIMLGLQMSDVSAFMKFISGRDCGPMFDILLNPNVELYINWLNNRNEEFDRGNCIFKSRNGSTVSLNDRLKEVYAALFVKSCNNGHFGEIRVGQMDFSSKTREMIEEIAAMLSPYSDYEFE